MERLAKEKIASQNRILFLKRELAQWDIDYSKLIPEQTDINSIKVERGMSLCMQLIIKKNEIFHMFCWLFSRSNNWTDVE